MYEQRFFYHLRVSLDADIFCCFRRHIKYQSKGKGCQYEISAKPAQIIKNEYALTVDTFMSNINYDIKLWICYLA